MSVPCYLSGLGAKVPDRALTNQDIETFVDTTDSWIQERTGIQSRHMLNEGEQSSDLATAAARQALATSGYKAEDITHVIAATCTPEFMCPSTACTVASKLGLGPVAAFDIEAACSGFVYGIEIARGIAATIAGSRVLLIGVEALTRRINWQDRGTCVLFGDGAGASIISADAPAGDGPRARVDDVLCQSDGSKGSMLTMGGGSSRAYKSGETVVDDSFFINMSGREVFKFAVRNMTQICKTLLERNGLTLDDVDLLIPHQANLRIIEAVSDRLGADPSKVFINIQHKGNTSAASVPLALTDAWEQGRLRPGMRVLTVAFGGGFTWAASLLRF